MKTIMFSVLVFLMSISGFSISANASTKTATAIPVSSPDEVIFYAMSSQFDKAWGMADSQSIANLYVENATLTTYMGDKIEGRVNIQKTFQMMMEAMPGSKHLSTITKISYITPDIVLIDGDCELSNVKDPNGNLLPKHESSVSQVLMKTNGKWMILHTRAYVFEVP